MKTIFLIFFLMLSLSVFALEMGSDDFFIYDSNKLVAKIEKKKFKELIDTYKYVENLKRCEDKGWIKVRFIRTDDSWIIKGRQYNFQIELIWFDLWEEMEVKKLLIFFNTKEIKKDKEENTNKVQLWRTAQ